MSTEPKTILVAGATGKQGGAVARHLLDQGFHVRALTRNPDSEKARELAGLGAEIVAGDMNDPEALRGAMKGADGVFSVQNFWECGYDDEVRQGKNVADAAKAEGVGHVVYSSVGGADRNTGIPHFECKWEVEKHIHEIGLPVTILRPVFFMENFIAFSPPSWDGSTLTLSVAMPSERPLQMIAVDDIGEFTARAFSSPGEYLGREIEIAGDELTMPKVADMLGARLGVPAQFVEFPMDQLRSFSEEAALMYEWFDKHGYEADIAGLRGIYPGLKSFETWLGEASGLESLVRTGEEG